MATLKEEDHLTGADREPRTLEEAAGEQPEGSPERRHVDALLDISEEDFSRELEPHEYHCYSGWEEAVQGWARVAPLSCILLTQKRYKKPKHKEAENPAPVSVDPAIPNTDSSAGAADHRCEPHSFKRSVPSNQRGTEWSVLHAVQKTTSDLLLEEGPSKYGVPESRPTKPQKHRPSNTVIPIKNFTFLPPIKSQHLNLQKAGGKKAPEGETAEESCFVFDKKSGMRGTRADPIAEPPAYSTALASKYRTCQHNPHPHLFSTVSVSIPKRYQVPLSSKADTVHRSSYSVGRSLTQALHTGAAAGAQARMRPSKAVCAVKLYEGCEINV